MNKCLRMDDGRQLALDDHGHLENSNDWSPEVAMQMAAADGIELCDAHWLLFEIFRAYHRDFEIEPPMRVLVRTLKEKGRDEAANSLALYRLFPEGPARQGSRYAGLPLPVSCI